MVLWFKLIFLSLSNITYLFPLYAVFLLLLTKFTLFLKSTSFLLANFPKLIFNQKKKSGFIWFKAFDILFQILQTFIQKKRVVPWKLLLLNFKNIGRNNLQFLQNLWKINMNINFFTGIFLYFFLLFCRNTYFKEKHWDGYFHLFQ